MPQLKMRKVEYFEVDCYDFEELVKEIYGDKEFSFVADQEASNDSQHTFAIDGKLDEYDVLDIAEIKEEKIVKTFSSGRILNDLCSKGIIPAGNYLISVCW